MTEPKTALVVGYDRTAHSRHALRVAIDLADRLTANLNVVHVVDLRDYPIDPDSASYEQQGLAQLDAELEEVKAHLATWAGRWSYDLKRGDPVTALVTVAAQQSALMIIVGTRGAGFVTALERLFSSSRSVSHGLTGGAIPVLVVPHEPDPGEAAAL
jgi:nucleotide-binding universal stress UspA family protein